MTVNQLRELLAHYPPDLPIMIDDYEGGYDEIESTNVALKEVQLNVNTPWYYGRHDQPEPGGTPDNQYTAGEVSRDGPIVAAIILSRPDRRFQRPH